ncbi:hypothetical protein ACHAXR_004530, partial [Thalassiosira sp. AJA248-18]
MGATEIAAMFKMGGATGRAQRRGIMRVLRYHFGNRYFEPEYKVQMLRKKRDYNFDESEDGKLLKKLKARVTAANKVLKRLGVINGMAAASSSTGDSPFQEFLSNVFDFIECETETALASEPAAVDEDEDNIEVEEGDSTDAAAAAAVASSSSDDGNMEVQTKIKEVQELIQATKAEIKPLQKRRNNIAGRVKKSNDYIKRTKEKIKAFKSDRKKSGSGIETAIFAVLKEVYDVRIQAYHFGSLTGKDIQKVVSNAEDICNMIAGILKRDRKGGCEYQPAAIDEMLKSFSDAFLLWDGAFSIASKVNPTPDDIKMYERYAKAAVYSHQGLGYNITHKVHLMYKHVEHQMTEIKEKIGSSGFIKSRTKRESSTTTQRILLCGRMQERGHYSKTPIR